MNKDESDSEDTMEQKDDASTSSALRPPALVLPKSTTKKKVGWWDEVVFWGERQKVFELMREMQNSNKEFLNKLIEKLGNWGA